MAKIPKITFSVAVFLFQCLLLGLFAGYAEYDVVTPATSNRSDDTKLLINKSYPQFQDVHVMIFFGIAFLMTFLRKYGYGAVTYNFMIGAIAVQWSLLLNQWVRKRMEGHGDYSTIRIGINELMASDFTAATVLISFGAVLGKASRLQLFVITIIECVVFAVNESFIMEYLHITDVGGSISVHLFAAYFGLAVAFVLGNSGDEHPDESTSKNSDLFAMAGTILLWIYWPSFNSAILGDYPDRQSRAVVNTYLALASCVVMTIVVSPLVNKNWKFSMAHIQNATLAGGVAVGTSADLMINPWGAILIGMIAAVVSVLGYTYLTPFLSSKLKIHDTCGIHNLHGLPSILAAAVAAIASPAIDEDEYGTSYKEIYTKGRSSKTQGGYQFAAALVAFAMAIVGGLLTGLIVKNLDPIDKNEYLFNDIGDFEVPDEESDIEANHLAVKQIPMKEKGSL